jgi:hypothetical protein
MPASNAKTRIALPKRVGQTDNSFVYLKLGIGVSFTLQRQVGLDEVPNIFESDLAWHGLWNFSDGRLFPLV